MIMQISRGFKIFTISILVIFVLSAGFFYYNNYRYTFGKRFCEPIETYKQAPISEEENLKFLHFFGDVVYFNESITFKDMTEILRDNGATLITYNPKSQMALINICGEPTKDNRIRLEQRLQKISKVKSTSFSTMGPIKFSD